MREAVVPASNTALPSDYTRTRLYATIDLLLKAVSSLGILTLGMAGWFLQSRTEDSHEAADRFERQERRYLPMLRSLSELQAAIDAIDYKLQMPTSTSADQDAKVTLAGIQLRYFASSVFMPDGDPVVVIRRSVGSNDNERERRVEVPLRAAAIMLAELMRLREAARLLNTLMPMTVHLDERECALMRPDGDGLFLPLSIDSLPAWRVWLGHNNTIALGDLASVDVLRLAEDINTATAATLNAEVIRHPELADRYVAIRDEIARERPILAGMSDRQ